MVGPYVGPPRLRITILAMPYCLRTLIRSLVTQVNHTCYPKNQSWSHDMPGYCQIANFPCYGQIKNKQKHD